MGGEPHHQTIVSRNQRYNWATPGLLRLQPFTQSFSFLHIRFSTRNSSCFYRSKDSADVRIFSCFQLNMPLKLRAYSKNVWELVNLLVWPVMVGITQDIPDILRPRQCLTSSCLLEAQWLCSEQLGETESVCQVNVASLSFCQQYSEKEDKYEEEIKVLTDKLKEVPENIILATIRPSSD